MRLKDNDLKMAMRTMLGDAEVAPREQQDLAMASIGRGDDFIVAVMAAGSGKSMLFQLPAWMEPGGTTIVVVPLVSLRADLIDRCRLLGISSAEWDR